MFYKIGVLKNFPKLIGLQLFYKKTLTQVVSCEFCEILKYTFSTERPLITASEIRRVYFLKRMVRLKYPIILISKLDSGLWACPDNLKHTASFILYTFLFSFHKKPCSQFSCVCVTLTLIREKNNV